MDWDNGHHLPLSAIQRERGSALPAKPGGWLQVFCARQSLLRIKGSGASLQAGCRANCQLFLIYHLQQRVEEPLGTRDGPSIQTGLVGLGVRVAGRRRDVHKITHTHRIPGLEGPSDLPSATPPAQAGSPRTRYTGLHPGGG